jgi:hypothetical protein
MQLDPLDRTCDGETLEPAAFAQATFAVVDELDVRARTAALAGVRHNLLQLVPWRPTAASAGVGSAEALTVAAGVEKPPGSATWTLCLVRGGEAI